MGVATRHFNISTSLIPCLAVFLSASSAVSLDKARPLQQVHLLQAAEPGSSKLKERPNASVLRRLAASASFTKSSAWTNTRSRYAQAGQLGIAIVYLGYPGRPGLIFSFIRFSLRSKKQRCDNMS
jgi:hypothetical protein